jgi:thiopurine S-methyltransferase
MEPSFWHEAWREDRTSFHQSDVHPELRAHAAWFLGQGPHHVLVPLCGKSRDLGWLARQGHRVLGIELSMIAIEALFEREGWAPRTFEQDGVQGWTSGRVTILCADFLTLPDTFQPRCSRLWDRAALVALPDSMRQAYVRRVRSLLIEDASGLVSTLESVPEDRGGPPFSVGQAELERHYEGAHVEQLSEQRPDPESYLSRGYTDLKTFSYRIDRCGTATQPSS